MAAAARSIPAKEFRRLVGDVLGRIQYGRESFIITRHGQPIARIVPIAVPRATRQAHARRRTRT